MRFLYFRVGRTTAMALREDPDALYRAAGEILDLGRLTPHANVRTLVGLLASPSFEEMFFNGGVPIDHIPLPELINSEEAEVMVCELSNVIRDALAGATPSELHEAGRLWATTEEFIRDGWDEESARSWAGELAALARRARDADEMIYCAVIDPYSSPGGIEIREWP
jgi:hypothetical protein